MGGGGGAPATGRALPPYAAALSGRWVDLAPLEPHDAPGLFAALMDPVVWRWLTKPPPEDAGTMRAYVEEALAERDAGRRWPWTVRARETIVGWTSFGDIEPDHGRIELGWTAYGVPWQRTGVNTECKLLLLRHLFEDLGYERVALKVDARNERSQRAVERLGAVREGVLRHHLRRPDGTLRDTVYYSVLRDEWPGVEEHLERLLRDTPGSGIPSDV